MKYRFRFKLVSDSEGNYFKVYGKRKSDGEWVAIGTCHISAKEAIQAGRLELLKVY